MYLKQKKNNYMNMTIKDIDVNYDFTLECEGYWDEFWERAGDLGRGGCDPDSKSITLRKYHQLLWSRELPNGESLQLEDGGNSFYLRDKGLYFSSDSILASFRYYDNKEFIKEVEKKIGTYYKPFIEDFIHRSYTIGGTILLQCFCGGLNQSRGCHKRIRDRWDLTMECIRRYYEGQESPLTKAMEKSSAYFNLFVDFKGFVDFFFLQDLVSEDYSKVLLWYDTPFFEQNPMPNDVDVYLKFIQNELDFLDKRNSRIKEFINNR